MEPLFDPFLDGFWCIAMAIRAFLDVRFSEKAPRVDSNPRATSAVLSGHLVSGGNHYTTAAVAGLRVATSRRCPIGRGGPFHA